MSEQKLNQLPNRDLWRGHTREPRKVDVVQEDLDPMNRAMALIVSAAKGAKLLTCIWCGQQGNDAWIRGHLRAQHKSVVEPQDKMQAAAQIAVAEAQSARAELTAAKAAESE